jgi:O-antigen/teichoic acid export membrane protein
MKAHLSNAAYGILDYAAYPIGMLVAAPLVLHNLSAAQYGVWTMATAAVSTGGILASGFGDANIQHVANRRGAGDHGALLGTVRSMMGINLVLGSVFALLGWFLSPLVASHVGAGDSGVQYACLWSLRIASVLMAVRAVESVCISTQRAFERYGAAVRISILARLLTLAAAAALTFVSKSIITIMVVSAVLTILGLWLQLVRLQQMLSAKSLMPAFDREAMRALLGFGTFSWLQAVSSVIFSQVDRLLLGVSLGAVAVASYALCAQMTQPIFGLAASGLHFLFPYLSNRSASSREASLRKPVLIALFFNIAFVCLTAGALSAFGARILHAWAGAAIAQGAAPVLSMLIWSGALLGLNVTGTYALLALGRVQVVTWFNLAGGAVMLFLMFWLTPRIGIQGIAIARLSYSLIALFVYIPLLRQLFMKARLSRTASTLQPVCEEQ